MGGMVADGEYGSAPPGAGVGFLRGEALGNDYLVFSAGSAWRPGPEAVAAVCHRRRGLGSDGVVWFDEAPSGAADPPGARFRARIFNPDGSEAERSGNGLRILAAALLHRGRVGGDPFRVSVGGDVVPIRVTPGGPGTGDPVDARVGMGRPEHGPGAVALDPGALDGDGRLPVEGVGPVAVHPVSVGNPHLVVFADDAPPGTEIRTLGPALSVHPALDRGANVQLARVHREGRIRAEVWERGAGWTPASGSSACAVAAAAVAAGRVAAGRITVSMPGGSLEVTVKPDGTLLLRGPARIVSTGELTAPFVASLGP